MTRRVLANRAALCAHLVASFACGDDPSPLPPAVIPDGGTPTCEPQGPFVPDAEPSMRLAAVPGELTIIQLHLPIGAIPRTGESAILIGPDGTIALLDVGAGSHADDVRDAVRALNTRELVPERGFPARAPLQVEWIVVTHFHGDHVGALEELLDGDEPLDVRKGVIHRGFVDVGSALEEDSFEAVCGLLRGPRRALSIPLCSAPAEAPCDHDDWSGASEADGCPGLFLGDLEHPEDAAEGQPTRISLGGCATMTFVAADAFVSDGVRATPLPRFGHEENNEENARSVVGLVAHGPFRYQFGGDLSGEGVAGVPDVETLLATTAQTFFGPLGVDVSHAHHHARRTSSNAALVSRLAPNDGRARNVVAGINKAYVGSPHAEVLGAWANDGRLGDGFFWITASAVGGEEHARLVDADEAPVIVQTLQGGLGYRVQAAGDELFSSSFPSVRAH